MPMLVTNRPLSLHPDQKRDILRSHKKPALSHHPLERERERERDAAWPSINIPSDIFIQKRPFKKLCPSPEVYQFSVTSFRRERPRCGEDPRLGVTYAYTHHFRCCIHPSRISTLGFLFMSNHPPTCQVAKTCVNNQAAFI